MARLRPTVVAVVIAAVLCVVLPTLHSDGTSAWADNSAIVAVGVASTSLTRATTPARVPTSSFPPASLLFAGFLALSVTRIAFLVLVGRHSRRLGDAGDGWRALLRGAPPKL